MDEAKKKTRTGRVLLIVALILLVGGAVAMNLMNNLQPPISHDHDGDGKSDHGAAEDH